MDEIGRYMADYYWVTWVILGAVAGLIAKAIMPGRDPGGCIVTPLIGIGGALLAGFLGLQLRIYDPQQGGILTSLLAAVIGALIILVIYRLIARRRF